MLQEAIFLATCNATNVELHVARKNSRVTPHFATVCNCCVASCKKRRTTLYFSQHTCSETSCLRVTSPLQLATHFCQNGLIRAQDVGDLARPPSRLLLYAFEAAKKVTKVWHPLCSLKGFLFVIVALQVARKIVSCNMAFTIVSCSSL